MLKTRSKLPPEAKNESDGPARALGRQLREAREARSEPLPEVAAYLRIKPAYLEALEKGDFSAFPARTYAMGFLRTYAQYLDLDAEALVDSLKPSIDRVAAKTELHYREPIAESRRGTAVMVALSLLLAGGVYTGYQLLYRMNRGEPEAGVQAPSEVAQLAADTLRQSERALAAIPVVEPPPPRRGAPQPTVAKDEPLLALTASEGPLRGRGAPAEGAAIVSTPTSASAAPASSREILAALESDRSASRRPAVVGDPSGRMALVATEAAWIQVRSPNKDYVRTRTLEAGERFTLPDRNDLLLWSGNGGGLELVVDGQSRGPLGRAGEPVKSLPLMADGPRAELSR